MMYPANIAFLYIEWYLSEGLADVMNVEGAKV